jgi:hypothetical protein
VRCSLLLRATPKWRLEPKCLCDPQLPPTKPARSTTNNHHPALTRARACAPQLVVVCTHPPPGPDHPLTDCKSVGVCLSLNPWMGGLSGRRRVGEAWPDMDGSGACVICWPVPVFPCYGFLGSGLGGRGGQEKPVGSGCTRLRGRVADDVVPQDFPSGLPGPVCW